MVEARDHVLIQRNLILLQVEITFETVSLAQQLLLVCEELLIARVEFLQLTCLIHCLSSEFLNDLVSHCYLLLKTSHCVILLRRCLDGPCNALAIHQYALLDLS